MIRRSCRVAHSCGHSCASSRSVRLVRGDLVSLGFEAGPPNDLLFGEPSKEQIPLGAFPQLVREQSEHGEAVLSGYVDLAVCLSRHCKLHGGASPPPAPPSAAEKRRCEIPSVVSIPKPR